MFFRRNSQTPADTRATIADLYETHVARVARYIGVRIGNMSEAEDLSAEVFVRALRSADSYKDTGAPVEAWIFRIARNIAVDYLRQRGRRPQHVPVENAFHLAAEDDPTKEAERTEEVRTLHQYMGRLTESQRQVLALRFGADMTSEEVGRVLGKSPGAVREMQSAAIKRMRTLMTGEREPST